MLSKMGLHLQLWEHQIPAHLPYFGLSHGVPTLLATFFKKSFLASTFVPCFRGRSNGRACSLGALWGWTWAAILPGRQPYGSRRSLFNMGMICRITSWLIGKMAIPSSWYVEGKLGEQWTAMRCTQVCDVVKRIVRKSTRGRVYRNCHRWPATSP
jgi:hypothetical protein